MVSVKLRFVNFAFVSKKINYKNLVVGFLYSCKSIPIIFLEFKRRKTLRYKLIYLLRKAILVYVINLAYFDIYLFLFFVWLIYIVFFVVSDDRKEPLICFS